MGGAQRSPCKSSLPEIHSTNRRLDGILVESKIKGNDQVELEFCFRPFRNPVLDSKWAVGGLYNHEHIDGLNCFTVFSH